MTESESTAPAADKLTTADIPTDVTESSNPWSSTSNLGHLHPDVDQIAITSQVNFLNPDAGPPQDVLHPSQPQPEGLPVADTSVLNEFDPLASDPVEKSARDAWATAEGHPALLTAEASVTSTSPEQSVVVTAPSSTLPAPVPQSAPAASSAFSSIASIARTLTLSPRRRSLTPPIPPPPRSSSLRHSHHVSMSSIPATATPDFPPSAILVNDRTSQTDSENRSAGTDSSVGVTINGSPKPDGQFDFQRFLDQMKMRGADPIAKYLRSFLSNFSKKTFTVNDQIKIIHDFLDFIADKMRTMDGSPWQNAPAQEFDNAMEAMEKLVMNRLYEFTFQPLLPPSLRTTDDLERDHVLRQRIALFGWLREEHLDVPTGNESGQGSKEVKGFLEFAQQELLKINHYKAPRDKLICILNSCKVIFGLIRHTHMAEGADSFIPILIYVVLKANPEHLLSNVEYINRFRSPAKLQSEAGYYLSSLMGAVSFIETMDHSSLSNISQEDFERNVEAAIQSLPTTRTPSPSAPSTPNLPRTPRTPTTPVTSIPARPPLSPLAGEEAARPLSLPMPSSTDRQDPVNSNTSQLSLADDTRRFFQRTSDTISKPLTAIGRIFSDVLDGADLQQQQQQQDSQRKMGWRDLPGPFAPFSVGSGSGNPPSERTSAPWTRPEQARQAPQTPMGDGQYQPPIQTPYKPRIRPAYANSPASFFTSSPAGSDTHRPPMENQPLAVGPSQVHRLSPTRNLQAGSPHPSRNPTPTLDFGALQDEIDRAHLAAQDAARETLMQIFPTVDREVAEMVLEANDGDLGKSIEGLLEISGGESAAPVA